MKNDSENMYEEWLTTIANTRLVFNTMRELESLLDNNSIHSNGIKRCYNSHQKLRAAYRDLKEEVLIKTNQYADLDYIMIEYKKAWNFYRDNLARRSAPDKIALNLLYYVYTPNCDIKLRKKYKTLFYRITYEDVNIIFLVLLLMKALPGYDSKDGDIIEFNRKFEEVMSLLECFTSNSQFYSTIPAINVAREAEYKSRLMLIYHTAKIIDVYNTCISNDALYNDMSDFNQVKMPLDVTGYWNDSDGKINSTTFFEFEPTITPGEYNIIKWQKKADNTIVKIHYSAILFKADSGKLILYMIHPLALLHRMRKRPYGDSDHTWYDAEMPDETAPTELSFTRMISSSVWSKNLKLTRVTDEQNIHVYDKWINACEIENPYSDCEYEYHPDVYAVTKDSFYIPDMDKNKFYKVPRNAYSGFENIKLGDNVGTMTINGKTYLAFDVFMLYVPTTKTQLSKYGIEIVNHID